MRKQAVAMDSGLGFSRLLRPDEIHLLFIATALVLALAAGFGSALALTLAAVSGQRWGVRWLALAQAHGQVQVSGWVGLFIMGMAYRLVPRFTARSVRVSWAAPTSYALATVGVVLRFIGQPLVDGAGRWLAVGGSALELAATVVFLAALLSSMRGRRARAVFTPFMAAGAFWFAAQAAMSLAETVRAAEDGSSLLPLPRDDAILFIQFYGFILMFVLGVSSRTVPVFFGQRPLHGAEPIAACVVLNVGVVVHTVGGLWPEDAGGQVAARVQDAGALVAAAAVLWLTALMGVLVPAPNRLRPVAQANAWLIRAAYAWLVVGGILLAYFAATAFRDGRPIVWQDADAVRHALALGTVSMMVVGMAYLLVPALAIKRPAGLRSGMFAYATLVALNVAAGLRVIPALAASPTDRSAYYGPMAAAGALGLLAVALLAFAFSRRDFVPPVPPIGDGMPPKSTPGRR